MNENRIRLLRLTTTCSYEEEAILILGTYQGRKHDKIDQNCLVALVFVCFGVVTLINMYSRDSREK